MPRNEDPLRVTAVGSAPPFGARRSGPHGQTPREWAENTDQTAAYRRAAERKGPSRLLTLDPRPSKVNLAAAMACKTSK
jgi:hypothetical protein